MSIPTQVSRIRVGPALGPQELARTRFLPVLPETTIPANTSLTINVTLAPPLGVERFTLVAPQIASTCDLIMDAEQNVLVRPDSAEVA